MADSNTDNLPLGGIRVLDLGTMTPGKYCTHLLSDLGADVIRIERHFAASIQIDDEDLILNRNKRSIALNLSTDEAKQVFYKLAQSADVILESHRPGVTSRMGVDYETIKKTNPRIIYCSLSGFGQDGPYAHLPAFDVVFMAIGGLLGLTAEKGQPPRVPRIYVSDAASGLLAAVGILTALVARQRTGLGQFVDIAMLDGVLSVLSTVSGFLLQHVFCGQLHQGLYIKTPGEVSDLMRKAGGVHIEISEFIPGSVFRVVGRRPK